MLGLIDGGFRDQEETKKKKKEKETRRKRLYLSIFWCGEEVLSCSS
jgi:hypothetical protein